MLHIRLIFSIELFNICNDGPFIAEYTVLVFPVVECSRINQIYFVWALVDSVSLANISHLLVFITKGWLIVVCLSFIIHWTQFWSFFLVLKFLLVLFLQYDLILFSFHSTCSFYKDGNPDMNITKTKKLQ